MHARTKNLNAGFADAGLLFVTGLFFFTTAFTVAYFSYFGLSPLPQSNKTEGMPAAAALSLPEPETPASTEVENPSGGENQAFFKSLPAVPVKEIFIGSYGTVEKEILERLQNKIEKTYGVKTTLLNSGPVIPKEEPFYDKSRNRYNSDVLQKSVEQSSAVYGQTARFLYVVDLDMSSFSDEESFGGQWLRAQRGQNAAIVSLQALRAGEREIFSERAEKTAIRALGITVGFDLSPSAADASCLMHPALTVEELDAQKNALCAPEDEVIARVFKR
jgi:predicted Zn-dependent protease